ncbi:MULTISPECIES: hypothetical protein [unclassified Nocardioides]|uniref:hypothetical protein n=1 Tax=unclassified Nocardioides TaxID=2615069 RepID=UPI00059FFD73|nr:MULTISPECIES: hypothetical protein [unclassified Nocardioides]
MTTRVRALALSLTAGLTWAVLITPTAASASASSCVAQSVQAEHEVFGSAWGRDLIAYLASHPEVLAEFGFDSFGDLASYSAHQDNANCPADL